eukprot:SAG22_NODE_15309_length_352_cov_0.600791_2_plen_33_part_01
MTSANLFEIWLSTAAPGGAPAPASSLLFFPTGH